MAAIATPSLPSGDIEEIVAGRHGHAFAVLGVHDAHDGLVLRAWVPGDGWQNFAGLRGFLATMWAYPGKKLLTPVPRTGYRVGLPCAGRWREILNTDAAEYGGSDCGNGGAVGTESIPSHGHAQSAAITVPPLGTLWLAFEGH